MINSFFGMNALWISPVSKISKIWILLWGILIMGIVGKSLYNHIRYRESNKKDNKFVS